MEYPWYLLGLIPLISGGIGYITNVVAVKMMFYPTEFVGVRPFLGWQGIVPANAVRLARKGLQLVTARLLKVHEVLQNVSPDVFLQPVEEELRARSRQILDEQAQKRFAPMWSALGDTAKAQIYEVAFTEVRTMSREVISQIMGQIGDLLDLQSVVVKAVKQRPQLMTRMFLEIGATEFRFIERSGWWFGLGFGMVQLLVWILYPVWWILPFFGFLVGYATNWIAIKLVFEPREPKRILGMTVQGLFHTRQKEVAREFARISTEDVFTDENLLAELQTPEAREKILAIVAEQADALTERYRSHPMAAGLLNDELITAIRQETLSATEAEMFRPGGVIAGITAQSEKIRNMLRDRMQKMDSEAFEAVLRPAFQADEWKLILAGAALGAGAGVLQLIYLFGQSLGG